MRRLAHLAGGFTLPVFVGVTYGLGTKDDKQKRQRERQYPDQVMTRFMVRAHLRYLHYPVFPSTLAKSHGEQTVESRIPHKGLKHSTWG